jgi:hypothetical protein
VTVFELGVPLFEAGALVRKLRVPFRKRTFAVEEPRTLLLVRPRARVELVGSALQRQLQLLERSLARHELRGPPLDVGFAPRQQLVGIRAICFVRRPALAPKSQAAASDSFLSGAGLEIRLSSLDFELAGRDLSRALA